MAGTFSSWKFDVANVAYSTVAGFVKVILRHAVIGHSHTEACRDWSHHTEACRDWSHHTEACRDWSQSY